METESRITREQEIAAVISARYSIDDQIALLRQKDSKPEEYQAFYAFAEEVKRKVTESRENEEKEEGEA